MGKGFPNETPNPSFVTATTTGITAIADGVGTVLETVPAIKGGDVAKIIDFTLSAAITVGVEVAVTYTVERDGVAFGEAYVDEPEAAAGHVYAVHFHWVDTTPGKGEPVYRVRGVAAVAGRIGTVIRRLTVHNI